MTVCLTRKYTSHNFYISSSYCNQSNIKLIIFLIPVWQFIWEMKIMYLENLYNLPAHISVSPWEEIKQSPPPHLHSKYALICTLPVCSLRSKLPALNFYKIASTI